MINSSKLISHSAKSVITKQTARNIALFKPVNDNNKNLKQNENVLFLLKKRKEPAMITLQ
jgi:hypothetical protein